MTEFTDPPGMPEDERMTDAEFRIVREFLGLTGDWLGAWLKVTGKTVRNWESGSHPIPDGVRLEIEDLGERTARYVGAVVEQLMDLPEPTVAAYRDDADYHAADPDSPFPASWHRAVLARVALEVPGLAITYSTPPAVPVDRRRTKGRTP